MSKRPRDPAHPIVKKPKSGFLKFYSKTKNKEQILSNFAETPFVFFGHTMMTGEAAFHWGKCKAAIARMKDPARMRAAQKIADKLILTQTGPEAKKLGGKKSFAFTPDELKNWNLERADKVQKLICAVKYEKYPEIKQVLEESKGQVLIHQDNRAKPETPWGARIDKLTGEMIGQNKLGKIWETFRIQETPEVIDLD